MDRSTIKRRKLAAAKNEARVAARCQTRPCGCREVVETGREANRKLHRRNRVKHLAGGTWAAKRIIHCPTHRAEWGTRENINA